MTRILRYQIASIINHRLKDMEKVDEKLIIFSFSLGVGFSLQELSSYVLKSLDISVDGTNRLVHLNNLVQHVILLSLLDKL